MSPYWSDGMASIFHGRAEAVLPTMAARRFSTVITDPPYHLIQAARGGIARVPGTGPFGRHKVGTKSAGFMGKEWDGGDIAFRPELWAEVLRVCKPGAFLLAFGGTRTFHRLVCAIEDAGWEVRDCIMWLYGSGFPKSLDISKAMDKAAGAERERIGRRVDVNGTPVGRDFENGKKHEGYQRPWRNRPADEQNTAWLTAPATDAAGLWSGWGTALKPAWEPIIVAMAPLDGTFVDNALAHGLAGLNIDAGRIGTESTIRNQSAGPTWSGEFKGGERLNGSTLGRWPANVILDEEAAALLDEQAGECGGQDKRTNLTPGTRPGGFGNVGHESGSNVPNARLYGDTGGASRFYYTAKASKSDRGHGNTHATVKPTALLKYLCKLTATPAGGEILDPFGGSMTTLVAAREAWRPAVAIEMEEEHCRIGAGRLSQGVLGFGGPGGEGEAE